MPFYQLFRQDKEMILTDEHHERIAALRKDLEHACTLIIVPS